MVATIRRLCKEHGITSMNALEAKCGLSTNTIYKWDEYKPSVDKVAKVAKELGVSVDELLREEVST